MPRPTSAFVWSRRRRRVSTALICAGPGIMVAGILATAITQALADQFLLAFLVVGGMLFTGGIATRYRADPVFAPPHLHDEDAGPPPRSPGLHTSEID